MYHYIVLDASSLHQEDARKIIIHVKDIQKLYDHSINTEKLFDKIQYT